MNKISKITAVVLLSICPIFCLASIGVSPMKVEFDPLHDITTQDITVTNEDNTKITYVDVTPFLVKKFGTKEKNIAIKNPKDLGLLVSPQKLVIPAKQSRFVRVTSLNLCPKDKKIYQLVIKPAYGDLVLAQQPSTKKNLALKLVVGYGVKIVVNPCNRK